MSALFSQMFVKCVRILTAGHRTLRPLRPLAELALGRLARASASAQALTSGASVHLDQLQGLAGALHGPDEGSGALPQALAAVDRALGPLGPVAGYAGGVADALREADLLFDQVNLRATSQVRLLVHESSCPRPDPLAAGRAATRPVGPIGEPAIGVGPGYGLEGPVNRRAHSWVAIVERLLLLLLHLTETIATKVWIVRFGVARLLVDSLPSHSQACEGFLLV